MVSLKQSLNDYERAQALARALTDTLLATLDSVRQYVIETDPPLVEQFVQHVEEVIRSTQECIKEPDEKSFVEIRTSVRGGLRDYRDRAGRYIKQLRSSLESTTAALDEMIVALQSGDSDIQRELKDEITRLQSIEEISSIEAMRVAVHRSAASFAACAVQLKREKDVVIAQLRDEIRTLQNAVNEARRAATIDAATGVYQRLEFEKLLGQEMAARAPVTVIRLTLQNLRNLSSWYQHNTIDQLLSAFCKRAKNVVPEDAIFGRWHEHVFCVMLRSSETKDLVAGLAGKCRGNYICMDQGHARTLYLQVGIVPFSSAPEGDADAFFRALDHVKPTT